MKIELVKDVKPEGVYYSVEKDGIYMSGSATTIESEAQQFYNFVVEHNGEACVSETLKSTEI